MQGRWSNREADVKCSKHTSRPSLSLKNRYATEQILQNHPTHQLTIQLWTYINLKTDSYNLGFCKLLQITQIPMQVKLFQAESLSPKSSDI